MDTGFNSVMASTDYTYRGIEEVASDNAIAEKSRKYPVVVDAQLVLM